MTQVATDDANRRLAGILAADVVGYSVMIGTDEPTTLARVRSLRTDLVEPLAAEHGGRLFKTTGDGFLAAFASAVQALRCAIAIQEQLRSGPDSLRLRIGVHQGEVVAEGDDLLGDGVIIAARLEPLAEPGGICISARVREDAAGKMALEVDDLGMPELKNIAASIQVFRVRLSTAERPPALPLPDKPSIAVLAFDNMKATSAFQFEDFILDLMRGALIDPNGAEVPLRAKSFKLLRLFVTNAGRLLDRNEINKEIWTDVIVTDESITQCVRDIRLALDDKQQRIIKTVPRRGYVFAAKVTDVRDRRLNSPAAVGLALPDKPSIAVLAFTNMSGDSEQEYFSDGIADDIITELSRIRWLFVIARNSSFAYKGTPIDVKRTGRELGVRYLLEGSVRRGGERVRVNAQLIDVETGAHVWAERYDRELADVFSVQDEITLAVTRAIEPAVDDAELRRALRKIPTNLGAWESYQRGMWYLSRVRSEDISRAREFFNRALELDPMLGAAHTALAMLFTREGTVHASRPLQEALRLAGDEAQKAVELDSADADALGFRALAAGNLGDYAGGFDYADRALLINPSCATAHHAKGWLQIFTGRPAEGRHAILLGIRLDPRRAFYPFVRSHIVMSYYIECDYETTVAEAVRVIADHPDHPLVYRWLAAALGQLGRSDAARAALNKAIAIAPDVFRMYVEQRVPWMGQAVYDHMLEGLRKAGWQG